MRIEAWAAQIHRGVVFEASLEIRRAIFFATIVIVVAVAPVFVLGGLSGAFFEPLALSYVLAMLASLIVAMTADACACSHSPARRTARSSSASLARWVQRRYEDVMARILEAPRPVLVAAGASFLPVSASGHCSGSLLLPSFKERDFLMHWLTKPGTSHPEMYRITVQASRELRSIPGVQNFGAHIGRAIAADEVVGINFTENWVSVDPKADYDTTLGGHSGNGRGLPQASIVTFRPI